jgi:hypothetical protein
MEDEFRLILQILSTAITRGESPAGDVAFDYDYHNLFRPLPGAKRGRVLFERVSQETAIRILRYQTHWYRRLSPVAKLRVKKLVVDSRGRRELKEYLHTVDGMVMSLIFSFPELFLARESVYELSDQITTSILHRCLEGQYTAVLKDFKRIRKEVKYHSMTNTLYKVNFDFMRRYSWMVPFLKLFNGMRMRTSKSKMFRVAMFCQTRASGLASQEMCEQSVKEFIDTVTVRREFTPNALLIESIDAVTSFLADKVNYGTNPMFKISASSAACFESSRRKGGKFGYLRKVMLEEGLEAPEHLLYSPGGQIGTPLFQRAVEAAIEGKTIKKVNIAAVRENAKARVITSGSFEKETLLQGFSHLTIEIIKNIRELQDSLTAARHGWKFISRLDYLDAEQCWPLFEEAFIFSFDWEKATDRPTHESARQLTGKLLEKLKIPKIYLDLVLEVWVGMKDLYYKGKHVGKLVNGIPMGDPLTKTNLSLAHPVCTEYARRKTQSKVLGAGNGDDGIKIPDKIEFCDAFNECASMLGYDVSQLDTFVTKDWGTYCEEYFYLPQDRFNTIKVGCRTNNTLAMPYLDFPKLRLILGTTKDREDYSSDIVGKVTLLGKDMEYVTGSSNRTGPEAVIFCIAAAFQDVSLGIIQDDKPLYLPRQVNGVGRPPGLWSVDSWMNIITHAKEWHRAYYLFAMRDYVTDSRLVTGRRGVLKESIHFNGEMRVETLEIPAEDPIKEQVELTVEQQKLFHPGVLMKLESLGYLVPESQISKYYLFNKRLRELNPDYDVKLDLFEKLKEDVIDMSYSPDPKVWRRIVSKFVSLYRDQPYALKADRVEPLYRAGTLDLLKNGDPLRVDIDLEVFKKFRERPRPDTPYTRNVDRLFQWYVENRDLILNKEKAPAPPTEVLEDDPIIIRSIMEADDLVTFFFIVTDDVKLYRLACNKLPSNRIGRIPIRVWFACGLNEEAFHNRFEQQFPGSDMQIIIDQGSIESYIMLHNISFSQMGRWMLYDKEFDVGYRGIPWTQDLNKTKKVSTQPWISDDQRAVATPEEAKFPWFGYTNPALLRNLRDEGACIIRDRSRSQSAEPESHVKRAD